MLAVRPKETALRGTLHLYKDIAARSSDPQKLLVGPWARSHLDCRSDVLTYTTEPLVADLHLAADVEVEIWCSADTPSHDLCAVLSKVHANGSAYNLTQGYISVDSNQHGPLRVSLQATCVRIAKGNTLRLSLSAASFPAYPINPSTGSPLGSTRLIDA